MSHYDILKANYEMLNIKYQTLKIENTKLQEKLDKKQSINIADDGYGSYHSIQQKVIELQKIVRHEAEEADKLRQWLKSTEPDNKDV